MANAIKPATFRLPSAHQNPAKRAEFLVVINAKLSALPLGALDGTLDTCQQISEFFHQTAVGDLTRLRIGGLRLLRCKHMLSKVKSCSTIPCLVHLPSSLGVQWLMGRP